MQCNCERIIFVHICNPYISIQCFPSERICTHFTFTIRGDGAASLVSHTFDIYEYDKHHPSCETIHTRSLSLLHTGKCYRAHTQRVVYGWDCRAMCALAHVWRIKQRVANVEHRAIWRICSRGVAFFLSGLGQHCRCG